MKITDLVSKLTGLAGARIVGAALGFISQLLLTRLLPAEDVGAAALAMSATALFALFTNGGSAMLAQTELPRLAETRRRAVTDIFHHVVKKQAITTFIILCAVLAAGLLIFPTTDHQRMALVFGAICAPAAIIMRYTSSVASSARKFRLAYLPDFLFRPTAFLLCLILLAALGNLRGAPAVLIAFAFVTYGTAIGQLIYQPEWIVRSHRALTPKRAFASHIQTRTLSLTIVAAVQFAFADIVILVSGFVLPEHEVAVVSVAMRLAALAGFVLNTGQMLVVPDLARAVAGRDLVQKNAIVERTRKVTVVLSCCVLAGAYVLGEHVLKLFGNSYAAGANLFVLLIVAQVIRAGTGMEQQLLAIAGRQTQIAASCLLAVVVFVLLTTYLSTHIGMLGIGLAAIAAELTWKAALATSHGRIDASLPGK